MSADFTPAAQPRPSPAVVRLVQFNCQRLFPQRAALVDHFSGMLRDLVPELRDVDAGETRRLSEEMLEVILRSALSQEPVGAVERSVAMMGRDNHRRGFPREGYRGAGHALLRSARALTDTAWSSELSSAWVAYYSWLADRFTAGADAAQQQGERAEDPPHRPEGRTVQTLDDVMPALRDRYFPADARGLESVCTRVMLRTGADLRAPRPDQRSDSVVMSEVLNTLTIMGYVLPVAAPTATHAAAPTAPAGRRPGLIHRLMRRGRH